MILAGTAMVLITLYVQDVFRQLQMRATRTQCPNNLRAIGLALHNYHEAHGTFPPPYTVDTNSQPLHSWRTLILPYLGQESLYKSIDLSKPWNDPANAKAYDTHLREYECSSRGISPGFTTYLAVLGDGCSFDPAHPTQISDVTDGLSNTVAVIDVAPDQAVHWMSPADASPELVLAPKSRHSHGNGTHVLILDGSVGFIVDTLPTETLRALLTIAGHETLGEW